MCLCKNIQFGSYDNQVSMKCPFIDRKDGWVCIDVCIATEIAYLWSKGIKTLNSCCGHNKLPPTVVVDDCSISKMIKLGYINYNVSNLAKPESVFLLKIKL